MHINEIIRKPVGADKSALGGCSNIPIKKVNVDNQATAPQCYQPQ
jgi:hypothetical protein